MTHSEFILYDGKFFPAGSLLISADNRCFRYGEGLFETMLLQNNRIGLWDLHMERLHHGMELLQLKKDSLGTSDRLLHHILQLVKLNLQVEAARIRLQVFRGNGDLKQVGNSSTHYIVQTYPLLHPSPVREKALVAGIHPHIRKSCDLYAQIKSCNYLPYTLAALQAKEMGWDECFVLNQFERISDASVANVFWIRDNEIYTPPLSEGPVAGVMRRFLLENAKNAGWNVHEMPLDRLNLQQADEVFVTNAVKGIQPVQRIADKVYGSTVTNKLMQITHLANNIPD